MLAPLAVARTTAQKLEQARAYFEQAKAAHTALQETPADQRIQEDYVKLIEAFRRVYLTAPTYGNNTICLMAIGELSEEMARRFGQPNYFQSAIEAYEFLLREYPHSQFRFDALLSIARVYRQDLLKPEEALKQYERYLKAYPRSAQAKQVEQTIVQIRDELGAQAASLLKSPATETKSKVAEGQAQPSRPAGPATVSDIRYWATPTYTRVVVDVEGEVKYEVGRLNSPTRLYVDLYNTRVQPPAGRTIAVGEELLKSVRLAQFRAGVSRLVLDLEDLTDYAVFELPNPYRLVIDVHRLPKESSAVAATAAPTPNLTEQAQMALTPPSAVPLSSGPLSAPKADTRAEAHPTEIAKATPGPVFEKIKPAQPIPGGSHSLTRALGLKIGRILLDPGHGGHDTGTIGPSGLMEKELVLDVAQRLGKLIEERLGSEVIYTRQEDTFVPLESRAAIANKMQADLFLSIHANSSRSRSARGTETYYLSLTTDPEALEVAARENAVSQETISQLQGLVRKIALHEKMDESKEFAGSVQSALRKKLANSNARQKDRGVKKAPFVVLIGANMPSVLTEVTFLSNPEEEKRLRTPEHRQQIAEALYAGIAGYVETLSGVKVARSEKTQTASIE